MCLHFFSLLLRIMLSWALEYYIVAQILHFLYLALFLIVSHYLPPSHSCNYPFFVFSYSNVHHASRLCHVWKFTAHKFSVLSIFLCLTMRACVCVCVYSSLCSLGEINETPFSVLSTFAYMYSHSSHFAWVCVVFLLCWLDGVQHDEAKQNNRIQF